MQRRTSIDIIADYLPENVRRALDNVSTDLKNTTEIRICVDKPVALIYPNKIMYLTENSITASGNNTSCLIFTAEMLAKTVDAVTHFSYHSHTLELQQGYFMLENGIRAGVAGRYDCTGSLRDITAIVFRISREVKDCCTDILPLLLGGNGVLICGGVNSGKTTILRDLCRKVGDVRKAVLIDERNEIACTFGGKISFDVGRHTAVLSGCKRFKGIISAVRSLSPDFIFCDEIASVEDTEALISAAGCGVTFCATIHAKNMNDLMRRRFVRPLFDAGIFHHAVFLKGAESPGVIGEIRRFGDAEDNIGTDFHGFGVSSRVFARGQTAL